jgi:hypothetical protein
MGTARSIAAAAPLANGKVLVVGGLSAGASTSQTADVYDPGTGTWAAVANAMSAERAYTGAAVLPNGKVLVAGGESIVGPSTTTSTDLYDPATNRFTPGPAMNFPRGGFGLVSLPAGQPLVIGGFLVTSAIDNVDPKASDAELYTPPALPGPPTSVSATPGNGSATVVFAVPASDGGLPVLQYTVRASTGQTATTPDARTFATVTGLPNGTPVTFTVTATTALGSGAASGASARVTPTAPVTPRPAPKLTLTGLRTKLKLSAFLKGVTFTAALDRTASLQVTLLGSVSRATIARAYPLVLATKTFGSSAKKRTLTIVPAKKLVGRPRKAGARLVIVATGATGLQSTITKQLTVTR